MRPSLPPYCCSFTLKSGETEDGIIGLYVAQEFTGETADRLRNDSHWGVPKSSIWMERRRVAMHFRDVFGLPWFLKMHLDMSPRFCSTSNIFVNSVYYCAFVMQKMQLEACGPKHHTVLMIYRCWWGRSKDEQMACYRFTSNACANAEKRSSVHLVEWVSNVWNEKYRKPMIKFCRTRFFDKYLLDILAVLHVIYEYTPELHLYFQKFSSKILNISTTLR